MSPSSPRRSRAASPPVVALVVAALLATTGAAASATATPTSTGTATESTTAGAPTLSRLQVEKKTEPVGIDVERPRFSWVIDSSARAVVQESYRLRVAESPDALEAGDVYFDSAVVMSPESANVEYTGPRLAPATEYFWRVDVVTSAGAASATSSFRSGLLDEDDWQGSAWIGNDRTDGPLTDLALQGSSWIWTPEATTPVAPAEPRAFRRTIDSPDGKTATRAEILLTGDDLFRLFVNGELLGESSGATNEWQQGRLFTAELEPDRNVVAVSTDNGADSPAGLVAVVRVTYSDGTSELVRTGTGWKGSKTVAADFADPGLDDSSWPAAVVQAAYGSGPWGTNVRPPVAEPNPAPLLRKEFEIGDDVRAATLFVAAGGYADVTINGEPVSDAVLSPGFTDYDDTVQYVADDVTSLLAPGTNAIGVELGRGFYGMTGSNVWNWQSPPWHDEPVVRAVLRVERTDGSVEHVVTDGTWTIHDGPTVFDDLYGGDWFDARDVQPGYDTVGFEDAAWEHASEVDGPAGELVNQRQQPIRVTEELPAVEITEPADGVHVVRFPRVIAGWVQYTVEGPAGTTVRAQAAEKLRSNGRVNADNNGGFGAGFQTDRFTLAGTGAPETWEPSFSYKGFQYVEVTGWPAGDEPSLEDFTAKVVHTDAEEWGAFESSEPVMNEVHRAVVDTLKNNIHGIPTDTPMFEKNGWTGDAAVGAEMFMTNLDTHELFAKWMRDVHETRDENGAPLVIAPSSADWGQWGVNPIWHSAYVTIPWWLYQYGGDERVLTEQYDGMKAYVDLELGRSADGLVTNPRLGDWVSPEASPAGGNAPEDTRVSNTAYLYEMLVTMQRTAEHLGRTEDAAHFAAGAATVKDTFNATFLDRVGGYYRGSGDRGYRQTHNVLALAFGLAPDDATAERVAASLVADIDAKGRRLNTGVAGTKHLLPVLTEHGYEDVAFDLAVETGYPSWGYMVENGGTTMWEHWSTDARSLGHYFLGTVDDWFYRSVGGIAPSVDDGYRTIEIDPAVTGRAAWARASTVTPFGPVAVDWRSRDRDLVLEAHVPVGTTARVVLPTDDPATVTEGGVPLDGVDGVAGVEVVDGEVVVTVGSGDYAFTAAGAGIVEPEVVVDPVFVDPATVAPGASTTVVATVTSTSDAAVTGRLEVTAPQGWEQPAPGPVTTIAPGASTELSVQVATPLEVASTSTRAPLGVRFVDDGTVLGSADAELRVDVVPVSEVPDGYDHVDLGVAASEEAHGLTASPSSGTSTEAGLTRRYAGHLTDFSFFEFDVAVVPGEPFLLRATETYDRSQTKRYKVYVDGEEVHLRQFAQTGAGTQTYQLLVPAEHATSGTVRVRFENQDDHSYYDPSIADVWTLPVPAAPADGLTVDVTAQTRCLAGTAYVAVRAENGEDVPVDVTLATPFGSRSVQGVLPGANAYQSFAVRAASVEAGSATVTASAVVDGERVTTEIDAPYEAAGCG